MIDNILEFSKSDLHLKSLLENVQEYAQLYLSAKQRQKGCDGMGEVATLKDEFVYYMDEVIQYCKEKGYLSGDIIYEVDSITLKMTKYKEDDLRRRL
ncbi:MAG: hypothetical protein ACPL1G_07535 [Thermodesulfovibrionales bacterium]